MQIITIENLILFVGIFFLASWVISLATMKKSFASLKILSQLPRCKNEQVGPKLSIIIAACNEEKNLEKTVSLILAQTYRELELILINDRSSDRTGEIIESYLPADSRVRSIHIDSLPEGWLGKVNALQKGVEVASGDYYLFTDADIEFSSTAISSAMAYVEDASVDHLVVFPFNRGRKQFLMGLLSTAFGMIYFNKTKVQNVNDPNDKSQVGIGAFNLVKRSAFEKTPGFSWLRMEVIDDVGLGLMLKRSGFRTHVLNGVGTVELNWYPNLWEMIKGLEKNLFPVLGHYRYSQAFISASLMLGIGVAPLAASIYTESWLLGITALLVQFLLPGILGLISHKRNKQNALIGFLIPIGYVILVFALVRSSYLHWYRKGIMWRGTCYSTLELQRGSRVRL